MRLHELINWVVDAWPPINHTVSAEFLLKSLLDTDNMVVASGWLGNDLPDREIDHPNWVIMVEDHTQMMRVDISWGDSIDDWIMNTVISSIHRGYEHLYLFSCDPDHPKYRDYIYISIEKVKKSDWPRLKNTLKEWSESREWPSDWQGTRVEWLQGKVKIVELTINQLEKRYLDFGIDDFVLKTVYDLRNVHGIDYSSVQGYAGLVHLFRVIYKKFIVNFFNAFDLSLRAELIPKGIYWVESIDRVFIEPDGTGVWAGGVVTSIDKFKEKIVLDDWVDDEYKDCDLINLEPEYYLRFEFKLSGKDEWMHVTKNGEAWY